MEENQFLDCTAAEWASLARVKLGGAAGICLSRDGTWCPPGRGGAKVFSRVVMLVGASGEAGDRRGKMRGWAYEPPWEDRRLRPCRRTSSPMRVFCVQVTIHLEDDDDPISISLLHKTLTTAPTFHRCRCQIALIVESSTDPQ